MNFWSNIDPFLASVRQREGGKGEVARPGLVQQLLEHGGHIGVEHGGALHVAVLPVTLHHGLHLQKPIFVSFIHCTGVQDVQEKTIFYNSGLEAVIWTNRDSFQILSFHVSQISPGFEICPYLIQTLVVLYAIGP